MGKSFTPGPWAVDDCIDSNGFFYYVLDGPRDIDGRDESKANARMISAAPEMYDALKTISDWAMTLLPFMVALGKAHAAIKKAEPQ